MLMKTHMNSELGIWIDRVTFCRSHFEFRMCSF